MGLDMYAKKVRPDCATELFDYLRPEDVSYNSFDLFYWRKHHELHNWMQNLYHSKGGTDEFNCIPLLLTVDDLKQLRKDIPDINDDKAQAHEDLGFVKLALKAIDEGYCVYYDSWY